MTWAWINAIQEWRADRIRRKNLRAFSAGYRYAKECLDSRMERPGVHLYNVVETAKCFGDYNQFDMGIEACMRERQVNVIDGEVYA